MSFWCLQFPPKNERKQVDLRFHSSKVEFVRLFFEGNVGLKKLFQICLTFSALKSSNKCVELIAAIRLKEYGKFKLGPLWGKQKVGVTPHPPDLTDLLDLQEFLDLLDL